VTYNNIAEAYDHQRDYHKALEWCRKALRIDFKVLGQNHPYFLQVVMNAIRTHAKSGHTNFKEWLNETLAEEE